MTIDEMIAVLQAAKAGKPAEQMGIDGKWRHVDIAHMTSYAPRLRVKPEPRECWVPESVLSRDCSLFPIAGWVKVREVLE